MQIYDDDDTLCVIQQGQLWLCFMMFLVLHEHGWVESCLLIWCLCDDDDTLCVTQQGQIWILFRDVS